MSISFYLKRYNNGNKIFLQPSHNALKEVNSFMVNYLHYVRFETIKMFEFNIKSKANKSTDVQILAEFLFKFGLVFYVSHLSNLSQRIHKFPPILQHFFS